ncbi:MAG TPA: hypothetical protein H9871_07620 [Candidatus Nesterenkonia stercoripullorum]|uniref:Uncharacterized protein n=1 Tax=Candidatus Nesterenkonia stercoripullorum TaxID=2838701 RepID=A0A9D1UTA9_9MICC|nr:hypothetical protein [Candidatus Nesterenkonia stercoripullorum]
MISELLRELSRARLLLGVAGVTGVFAVVGLVLLIVGLPGWAVFVALLGVQLAVLASALILHRALMRGGRHQGTAAEIAALQGSSDSARLSQAIHAMRQEFSVRDTTAHQLEALLHRQEVSRRHIRRELFDEYFGAGPGGAAQWSIVSSPEQRGTA